MTRTPSKIPLFYPMMLVTAGIIAFLETGPGHGGGSSLLMTLVFWITVVEGCIAVAAICDLVHAKWIVTLKEELLSPVPLLLFLTVLFLLLGFKIDLYPWMQDEGRWLNKPFFLIRNAVVLLVTYGAALRYAALSREEDDRKVSAAVLYLFAFVLSQSLVAFDWVMSLDYPWYSTLFGAYFFVEAIFSGLAVAGILFALRYRREVEKAGEKKEYLRDLATLLFGFSILWGGLFFTQYLVIWYGNLPEEVVYLVERITDSPWRELSFLVILCFFAAPFFLFLPRRTKTLPGMVTLVSLIILGGLFVERLLFLKPALPLPTMIFLLESLGFFLLFSLQVGRSRA